MGPFYRRRDIAILLPRNPNPLRKASLRGDLLYLTSSAQGYWFRKPKRCLLREAFEKISG